MATYISKLSNSHKENKNDLKEIFDGLAVYSKCNIEFELMM